MSCSGSEPSSYCVGGGGGGAVAGGAGELKLYQAFIFSVPVFFTFLFLLLFYLLYLRRRGATWQNVRLRASRAAGAAAQDPRAAAAAPPGVGIKKEVREMLPVVVFRESFLIRETQCSVCLGDYKSDERLKRIPPCGHTFHVDCIDHWLTTHSTCPLCRVSLLQATKASIDNLSHTDTETQQLQEQPTVSQPDTRAVQQDDTAREEEETGSGSHELECPRREAEESRRDEEGSDVAINIESNVGAEEDARL
ncbi:putative RING-H2 finger protein ATL58 [Iris pallida]|uniref:RING-type E3 ubiquitin transferase n=1 Tax=Iris pallida TaxID=29817 RepID=A0AAX6EYY9_IRIPA|nr:putative RING-H2 finger protein ATL58 [Iris pallida]